MGFGGSSPASGSSCATCLKKFTLHFRRMEDSIFDGSFGFDWYRAEFYHPLTRWKSDNSDYTYLPLVKGDLNILKATYTKGQKTQISPFGTEYIPAWLALNPSIYQSDPRLKDKNGVLLNLELIPLTDSDQLESDGTKIIFESSHEAIVIEPKEFPLDDFKFSLKRRPISFVPYKEESYYILSDFVRIKCTATFEQHEEINVYAVKGESKEKIGKLMLYHNAQVPKLQVTMVDFLTSVDTLKRSSDWYNFIKYSAFNQALINFEVLKDFDFDINKHRKPGNEVDKCLTRLENRDNSYILSDIGDITKKYIDPKYLNKRYIFLSTVSHKSVLGAGAGNQLYMFGGSTFHFNQILAHELGHCLGLDHLFDAQNFGIKGQNFTFLQGQTSNFLDYSYSDNLNLLNKKTSNPNMYLNYFFKYQWDLLRKKLGA